MYAMQPHLKLVLEISYHFTKVNAYLPNIILDLTAVKPDVQQSYKGYDPFQLFSQ